MKKKLIVLFLLSFCLNALATDSDADIIVNGQLSREALLNPEIPASAIVDALKQSNINFEKAVTSAVKTTESSHFTKIGDIAEFDYVPSSYSNTHAILYYIPKSLEADIAAHKANVAPVVMIMHGGGNKTNTYELSKKTALIYVKSFRKFAEQNKVILIAPSSSLGWSAHAATFLMREITALARRDLNVSGDEFYLFGHSMGGMGITRSASNMGDEFAGFLPTASGMVGAGRTEANLRPYLNMKVTHINGKLDTEFPSFEPDLLATEEAMKDLAAKENMPLNYKALIHPAGHDFDPTLTFSELLKLMKEKRDLYQPRLFSYMGRGVLPNNAANPIHNFVYQHSYWAKAIQIENIGKTVYTHWNYVVNSKDNAIEITNFSGAEYLKRLKLFISSKLLDFSRPIKVIVEGRQVLETKLSPNPEKTIDIIRERGDPQFYFEESIELVM